jgi:hypothetical protein
MPSTKKLKLQLEPKSVEPSIQRSLKKLEKETFGQQRISNRVIIALLHSLELGGKLLRNAFGTKVVEILGGLEHVTTKNIKRKQKVCQSAAQFVVELRDEATAIANGELMVPEDQCKGTKRDNSCWFFE